MKPLEQVQQEIPGNGPLPDFITSLHTRVQPMTWSPPHGSAERAFGPIDLLTNPAVPRGREASSAGATENAADAKRHGGWLFLGRIYSSVTHNHK